MREQGGRGWMKEEKSEGEQKISELSKGDWDIFQE